MDCDALGEDGRVVAAFEDADEAAVGVGVGDVQDHLGQGDEIFGFETQVADGVEAMGVEAGAEEDELGLDFGGELFEVVAEEGEVFMAWHAEMDGEIEGSAEALAGAGFVGVAGAGEEGPAVDGEESDARIFPERGLGTVAVVDVPVDDEDAIEFEDIDGDASGDGDVVEEAEAHGAFHHGVVAWGTHEAEGGVVFASEDSLDGVADASDGH